MRVRLVQLDAAGRDQRRERQPRALALVSESAERGEVEIVLRRDLLQARVQHRREPGAGKRVSLDRGGKSERDRAPCRFVGTLAGDNSAPPGEPHRREIGIAGASERLADFVIERRKSVESVARAWRRIERAKPLIAALSVRQRGAISVGLIERALAFRTARAHGAAIRAAATRRFSDCMTL